MQDNIVYLNVAANFADYSDNFRTTALVVRVNWKVGSYMRSLDL